MKLIKKLGIRYNKTGTYKKRWGLFLCPTCNRKIEREIKNGRKANSCKGCCDTQMDKNHNWRGGVRKDKDGYLLVRTQSHPFSDGYNYVRQHRLVAEKVLCKFLSPDMVVHHINGDKSDNCNQNLIVCESTGYHLMLHARQKAYEACGNASWRKCKYCHQYDAPDNLYIFMGSRSAHHRACHAKYERERRTRLKGI